MYTSIYIHCMQLQCIDAIDTDTTVKIPQQQIHVSFKNPESLSYNLNDRAQLEE